MHRDGVAWKQPELSAWYFEPTGAPDPISFEYLLGRPAAETVQRKGSYTMDNTVLEMKEDSLVMKLLYKLIEKKLASEPGTDKNSPEFRMAMSTAADAPLRAVQMFVSLDDSMAEALLAAANGRPAAALRALMASKK